jgi:hypothetical protein
MAITLYITPCPAAGGSGADGLSLHFAHRSHTEHWVAMPDYRAYEDLSVSEGLSVQADEMAGDLILLIDQVEIAREAYSGGRRGLRLSLDWSPERLLLSAAGVTLSLPTNGSTPPLRPGREWVLTAAARTGTMNNVHAIDNVSISRCYRDYAAMRAPRFASHAV